MLMMTNPLTHLGPKLLCCKKKVVRSEVSMKKSAKLKKGVTKKSLTSKSYASKASDNIVMATKQVYQVALKSIILSLAQHCPREILIEISKYINTIYPKLKDLCLNSIMENDTVKRRELV